MSDETTNPYKAPNEPEPGSPLMNEARHRRRLFVAQCALALFIIGLVLPFVMSLLVRPMHSSDETISLYASLSGIAEFSALALGFLGRRHLSGKVAMVGAILTFGLALFAPFR